MNAFDQAMDSRRVSFYDFDEAYEHGKKPGGLLDHLIDC